jgi:predicted HAD superfamily Cof-like phosphohydrolase
MSTNWVKDIAEMHTKFGTREAVAKLSAQDLAAFVAFRMRFINEESDETYNADTPAEFVDGLIDLCVVAIGTLDAMGVDAETAWNRVLTANMSKEVGVKDSRPNPLGLPDLVKPEGWKSPTHEDNVGILPKCWTAWNGKE